MACVALFNKVVSCEGDYIEAAGLCSKHMVLFEIWIDAQGGHRVYQTEYPRSWKRSVFHKWLNKIGTLQAQKIYERACRKP